ncbi:uncharacterized protein VTP21DRAFT_6522 [Calcarisporiella thermophila]|uniref:uncharacterized protein n=1 Tax=Calcarisporiella thermophila TaxID=911321 RepID=UPI00374491AA
MLPFRTIRTRTPLHVNFFYPQNLLQRSLHTPRQFLQSNILSGPSKYNLPGSSTTSGPSWLMLSSGWEVGSHRGMSADLGRIAPHLKSQKNELKLKCTEFDHQGNVKVTAGEFLKTDLCAKHGLQPRDLRKIDSHFINQMPAILVRKEAILVNLTHIRALIKADTVLLFDSFGSTDSYNQSLFIYDLQEKLSLRGKSTGGLPFEFRALEAIFISVISCLHSELDVLENLITDLLARLEENIDKESLKALLQYSKKLTRFEQKALGVRNAIVEVLEQDDDLAAMYLTEKKEGRPRTEQQHEEIELLLESYLKQTDEIVNVAARLHHHIQSTEEVVNIMLDANRNAIMIYDLQLTVATLGVATSGVVAGLYGMNVENFIEKSPYGFVAVAGTAVSVAAIVIAYCRRRVNKVWKSFS